MWQGDSDRRTLGDWKCNIRLWKSKAEILQTFSDIWPVSVGITLLIYSIFAALKANLNLCLVSKIYIWPVCVYFVHSQNHHRSVVGNYIHVYANTMKSLSKYVWKPRLQFHSLCVCLCVCMRVHISLVNRKVVANLLSVTVIEFDLMASGMCAVKHDLQEWWEKERSFKTREWSAYKWNVRASSPKNDNSVALLTLMWVTCMKKML